MLNGNWHLTVRKFFSRFRKLSRFVIALFLWLHAAFIVNAAPSLAPIASKLNLNVAETALLFLLASAALLSSYGIKNILVDAIYFYCFPFILLFHCTRMAFHMVVAGYRFFWHDEEPFENPLSSLGTIPQKVVFQDVPVQNLGEATSKKFQWRKLASKFSKPFRRFTLLWCLLIALTSHRFLLSAALAVLILHIIRFLLSVLRIAVASTTWSAQLEQSIRTYAEDLIEKVRTAQEITQEMRQTWSGIVALKFGITLLQNRRRVTQWAAYLVALSFLGAYLYLAILFSFAYLGTAHLQGISLSWTSALIDSTFIPLAYADLPQNNWLKLIGGIQAFFVLLVGIGTVFAYLQKKIESLHSVANNLSAKLQQAEIQEKLARMNERFSTPVVPRA
jgi:hypothetical protein